MSIMLLVGCQKANLLQYINLPSYLKFVNIQKSKNHLIRQMAEKGGWKSLH